MDAPGRSGVSARLYDLECFTGDSCGAVGMLDHPQHFKMGAHRVKFGISQIEVDSDSLPGGERRPCFNPHSGVAHVDTAPGMGSRGPLAGEGQRGIHLHAYVIASFVVVKSRHW